MRISPFYFSPRLQCLALNSPKLLRLPHGSYFPRAVLFRYVWWTCAIAATKKIRRIEQCAARISRAQEQAARLSRRTLHRATEYFIQWKFHSNSSSLPNESHIRLYYTRRTSVCEGTIYSSDERTVLFTYIYSIPYIYTLYSPPPFRVAAGFYYSTKLDNTDIDHQFNQEFDGNADCDKKKASDKKIRFYMPSANFYFDFKIRTRRYCITLRHPQNVNGAKKKFLGSFNLNQRYNKIQFLLRWKSHSHS